MRKIGYGNFNDLSEEISNFIKEENIEGLKDYNFYFEDKKVGGESKEVITKSSIENDLENILANMILKIKEDILNENKDLKEIYWDIKRYESDNGTIWFNIIVSKDEIIKYDKKSIISNKTFYISKEKYIFNEFKDFSLKNKFNKEQEEYLIDYYNDAKPWSVSLLGFKTSVYELLFDYFDITTMADNLELSFEDIYSKDISEKIIDAIKYSNEELYNLFKNQIDVFKDFNGYTIKLFGEVVEKFTYKISLSK